MANSSTHECPGYECENQVSGSQLMCRGCWGQVPPPLQREVYAAWDRGHGRGSLRHLRAVTAAIESVTP
jgi:hypothetical protein